MGRGGASWALRQAVPTAHHRLVLAVLADLADDNGVVVASADYLADATMLSNRTVRRHGATARGTSLSRWVIDRSLYQTTMYEREALSTGTSQAQSLLNDVASAGALVNDGARQANTDGTLISEWADLVQWTSRLVARCDEFTERFHPTRSVHSTRLMSR